MGQTTEIFPRAKKIYKSIFRSKKIDYLAKLVVTMFVNLLAKISGFYFPEKFNWDWKFEMLSGRYEADTVEEFKKIIKPGMTVIDIGAHVGYFTRLFSRLVGKRGVVIAFEADINNYNLLNKNTHLKSNVKNYHVAVADKNGTVDFFKTVDKTGSHSLVASETRPDKITVSAQTLDDFLAEKAISQVDIIKMDIEGGEPLALKGMTDTLSNNKNIKMIMEFSPENISESGAEPKVLLDDLSRLGFKFKPVGKNLEIRSIDDIIVLTKNRVGYINLLIYRDDEIK